MKPLEDLSIDSYRIPDELAKSLVSPALVIDLAKVRHNLEVILARVGDPDRWRPHVKTTKSPLIWSELVARGVRHFKCATAREARSLAEMLESKGPSGGDILLAHPAHGPTLQELGRLARKHDKTCFSILSEDPSHACQVPGNVGIFVDVNPGYHRTGLGLERGEAILAVAEAAGERFRGLHHYEGQLTDSALDERRRRAFDGYQVLLSIRAELEKKGLPSSELITSGTPGFECALEFPGFASLENTQHRVSPGTVIFHDWRSHQQNPERPLLPAAVVFTRVISRPAPGRFTCDAGSKSIAAEAGHPCALAVGHPEYTARIPSEEHLPFQCDDELVPALGTELYLVPLHVCPTVNLAEQALLVESGSFVGLLPIVARSHDVLLPDPGESQ